MDSFRSEYSDAGSGPSGSSSALSFLDASSFGSSRASTTRTDFVSNYEQKFFKKKEKKKKREKRLAEATSNQLTADDRRRADREAERRARQAEMETWLPTDATLRALDADRRKRSRDRMRHVLHWYPPLEEQEEEGGPETHATLVGMTPARRRQQLKRQTEIAPLFAPESTDARDSCREQQQRALRDRIDDDASALQRRVAELQQRLACVETLRLQARPDPTRKRLVPLATTQSVPTLLPHEVSSQPRRKGFGSRHSASTTSFLFRDTPQEAAHARALEALELDAFLDAHKREVRRHGAACTLQATWRMARVRRKFLTWRSRRTRARRTWFQLWTLTHRITRHAQRAALRKCFRAWQEDVASVVRLRALELRLFREAEQLPGDVPKIVRNLVFMADDDDDAYARKVLAHPLQASSYATGFVNAAFASVEQQRRATGGHRVRLLRAQHLEAKRAVAKKIVQRLFLLWKRVHADDQRIGLNAQLCIKRAARQAFRRRPVWAGEKLLTVLELWARYAAFTRSKRLGVPLPHFPRPLPLWDVWLHNYQERQVRAVKAAARAPLARMRRCFHRVRAFTAVARHARAARDRATRHGNHKTVRAVLLAWRHAIADAAAQKKKLRTVLRQWGAYATRKSTMRPWKQQLEAASLRREQLRAWVAWRHVQLRSCFTRELHRARLASQPAWRWKVQRVLLMWMDLREPLRKWACFVAWHHCVKRRKLFLTLQRHCAVVRRRHLLYGVLGAWKAVVWKQEDAFLEDRLRLSAWDAYRELSPLLPMLFYGSFSDAAALFGGVGTGTSAGTPVLEDVLASRQRELRAFHAALVQGSVAEARNLILSRRHLVNGVDDAKGNTALHVAAAQLDDAVRRVEITTLLLTEGARTGDKPNRHGLTPTQLAADETTRRLLTRGVYAFHADGVLKQPPETENGLAATRLVWCLVARMSSEYVRGDRVGSDVRRAWHSELQDELWLRRGRVSFAATSVFSRAIQRCRAFLNGIKRRVCRSKDDVLLDLWMRVQHRSFADVPPRLRPTLLPTATRRLLSRDLARVEEKTDLLAWLKNTPDDPTRLGAIQRAMEAQQVQAEERRLGDRAASLGEYGAYAEALLWPVLQDERAEQALVHTFVGVVFSLSFPVEVVLAQATRLENECARLENDVLHAYQAIMREELRGRGPDQPHGLPLLRYFTEQSDAEFFFKRELLRLNTELFRGRPSAETDDDPSEHADSATQGTPSRAELQLDADVLLAKAQRKQRKVDKKVAASEQQVARLTDANTRVLLAVSKEPSLPRLREICDARIRLEDERLRLAHLLLKQLDWADTIQEIVTLKRSLDDASESGLSINRELLEEQNEMLARRAFLQAQLVRYTHELKPVVSSRAGPPTASAVASTTELRRLHKAASTALWALLVRNLFRACCCWLAENLLKHQEEDHADDPGDAPRDRVSAARVSVANLSEPVASVVTTTFAEARKASIAAHASEGRRRSSLSNAREALDTMQRSAAAGELHEALANAMQDNYASSSHLLFESDRDAMHAEETRARERALAEEHERSARSAVAEFNPRTGQVETPSSRLLDADEMLAMTHDVDKEQDMDPGGAAGDERAAQRRRNRKRELMRRAMAQRQLQRLAGHPAGHEESSEVVESPVTCSPKTWGPLVDGVVDCEDAGDVGFGTFVVGPAASATSEHKPLRSLLPFVATANKTIAAALAESMWRRGGTVRRHGEPHSASVSLAAASPPKSAAARDPSGSELFASAEDEMAFNTAFRVMSASKERRATPSGRRLSTIGGVAGSGLGAVSPRAQAESIGREDRDVSTPLLEDFDLRLLVEEAEANGAADAMEDGMEDGPVITEQAQDEEVVQRMVCVSPPEVGVVSALASLVSATDETEFFNQTLEQYLTLVRRDSLVVTVDRRDSVGDDSGASAAAVSASEQEVPTATSDASSPVVVDERVEDGAAAINQWRTPLIKWEPSPNEPSPPSPPRPLHVESTRLLVPPVAVQTLTACETSLPPSPSQPVTENAVLWNTLLELERKDADERRLQALQKQPLVLSGTTTVMAARRRKASVVSTLLKKDASLKSVRTVVARDDDPTAVAREETVGTRLEAVEKSPSVPKILVAIQRKASHGHKPASGETLASETVPSPTRRQAQHKPLSLPHCDLQLEPAAKKKTAKPTTTSRRRTTQVEPAQSGASGSLSRQPSRLSVEAAPIAFCLEGARALGPASKDPLPTAAVDAAGPTLPVLTEEQKRSVWRNFTAAPLSDATQDAYAQLHPALYAPVTPEPSTTPTVLLDPRRLSSDAATAGAAVLSVPQQIALDRRFWSAVEGFKSVGNTAALVPLDDKTASRRRVETAVAIYQQFLSPTAPSRLAWLSMYSQELRVVERRLLTAPRALFDALQQTAQLHISTLQAQQR